MSNVLNPQEFKQWVNDLPAGVGPPPTGNHSPVLDHLRQQSAHGDSVEPLAVPGGPAADPAGHDSHAEERRQLKLRLAVAKLHSGLIVAALQHTGAAPPETPTGVSAYVERAARWIEATTAALAAHWGAGEPGQTLSPYHRYEIARILVAALAQRPALPEEVEPLTMGQWLSQAPPALAEQAPPATRWQSAGADLDERLAWSRALTRVLEAAAQAPFARELSVLLEDARVAIASEAERQTALIAGGDLPGEALRIVQMHALKSASRLYAATLAQVYQASARMIEQYRDLTQQGKEAEADRCAVEYQDRHLGYGGMAHHFRENGALHEQLLTAAAERVTPPPDPGPAAEPVVVPNPVRFTVGSLVIATRATAVCDAGERGVCYQEYQLNGRPAWSFIFESGRYDGFSSQDASLLLQPTGEVCAAVADYPFQNVTQLRQDFLQGRFNAAFAGSAHPSSPAPVANATP